MRILFVAIALSFLFLTMSRSALACDCVTLSQKESFDEADVVFEGELVRVETVPAEFYSEMIYTFSVNKVLKGQRVKEIAIVSYLSDCDATFSPDSIYRVYARESQGKLISSSCGGNEVLLTREIISNGGMQPTSVWQLWYVKVFTIAVIALFLILLVQKSSHLSKILKNQP